MQFFLSKIDRRTLELWHFFFDRWKNDVFAFYKGCQQSYREPFINFLFLLGHSQRKMWFYHFFQKIFEKKIFYKFLFSINRIFRLGIFMISKKTIKKWPFFAVDPTTSLFQFFFVVLLYHSNRSRSDNQIFH